MPRKKKQQKPANGNDTAASKPDLAPVEAKAKAEKKTKAEKKPRASKTEKKISVKSIARDAIVANPAITNEEIMAAVKKARPDSSFGDKQAQWYRWMAKKGILTGTPIEMPRQSRKADTSNR